MSAFSHGFKHGFNFGMFNGMFGGGWCNPFGNPFSGGWCNPFSSPFSPMFGGFCNPFNGFGGGCNFGMHWNSAPMFMVPSYSFGCFTPYQSMSIPMPSIWNTSVPNFNTAPSWNNVNYSTQNLSTQINPVSNTEKQINIGDTFTSSAKDKKTEKKDSIQKTNAKEVTKTSSTNSSKTTSNPNKDFNTMLNFVLGVEGGYNPNDCGQPGNRGVLQSTYDSYRNQKGLSTRPVENITNEEVKDLYYTMFYKASGADKIDDPKLALYVFDTAVNMGVSAAKDLLKKSGNDAEKFKALRLQRYKSIATNNPSKAKYLNGWQNRVTKAEKFANNEMLA